MFQTTKFTLIGLVLALGVTGCVGRTQKPVVQPRPTPAIPVSSTPTIGTVAQGELYVVHQPPSESCSDATPELDFQDPRYANAEFICSINDQYNLVLRTKPDPQNISPEPSYLLDGYLEEKISRHRLPLWQDDIYLYPPNPMVSYDHKINGSVLKINSTRGDSGGYREEQWYVDLRYPKLLLNFVYTNEPKISYRQKNVLHVVNISGVEDNKRGTYILKGITKDGLAIHNFPSQPVKLENPCEINCLHIPEFVDIEYDAQKRSLSFDTRSAIADYGHVIVMLED